MGECLTPGWIYSIRTGWDYSGREPPRRPMRTERGGLTIEVVVTPPDGWRRDSLYNLNLDAAKRIEAGG